jgi:hypothetical protein
MPKKTGTKRARPRLFIGSAAESLDHAYAIQQNLEYDSEPTVWTQGLFELNKTSLENLERALDGSEFAIFIFTPDDELRLREETYPTPRDNIVFELGLSIGKLGRERTFIVVPRDVELRVPTDLIGITPGTFDSNRSDANLQAALGPFCNQVRKQIRNVGGKAASKRREEEQRVSRAKRGLLVLNAKYGAEVTINGSTQTGWVEVSKQLNAAIVDDKLRILVGNELAGDPLPNVQKELVVKYKYKGQERTKTAKETTYLELP